MVKKEKRGGDEKTPETDKPPADVIQWYDENFERAIAQLAQVKGEDLVRQIDFFGVFNLPGIAYAGLMNNHSIHHRGQLSSYLRPMGSKVPSIYGPSGDEPVPTPAAKAQTIG